MPTEPSNPHTPHTMLSLLLPRQAGRQAAKLQDFPLVVAVAWALARIENPFRSVRSDFEVHFEL